MTGETEEVVRMREKIQTFDQLGYHIVCCVGSRQTGKSSIVCSLFNYFRDSSHRSIGETIDLSEEIEGDDKRFWAEIYEKYADGNKKMDSTREVPFFVPMVAKARGRVLKLAFVEVRGELFESLCDPKTGPLHAPFPSRPLLFATAGSKNPITWLLVGSTVPLMLSGKNYTEDRILQAFLQNLRSERAPSYLLKDHFLFIVSKIDRIGQEFQDINAQIRDWIIKKFPVALSELRANSLPPHMKTYYSTGVYRADGSRVDFADPEYAQCLWHYLFNRLVGIVLYPEFERPEPLPRPGLLIRLIRAFGAPDYKSDQYAV